MMVFSFHPTSFEDPSAIAATCAAIRCLLAYADRLDGSEIDVVADGGAIVLEGFVPSRETGIAAVDIAASFASKRVVSNLVIRERTCQRQRLVDDLIFAEAI